MRVLAQITTFNAADIIDRTIEALQQQTRPVDEILVVDNASSDGTLERPSVRNVTVIRHQENSGTSGAVATGMRFAMEQGYDWIWVLDHDSMALSDALERLLELYNRWPQRLQIETGFLACMARNQADNKFKYGDMFTRRGIEVVKPPVAERHYRCHAYQWSGSLYRIAAVREIGLPNPDYFVDIDDVEYGYRLMKGGYKNFVHQDSVLLHNIRGNPSLIPIDLKVGPMKVRAYEFPPLRCYYYCRNSLYFILYEFEKGRFGLLSGVLWRVRRSGHVGPIRGAVWNVLLLTMNFLLRPRNHVGQIHACFRGAWHGVTGNIKARY
jgi:rhamnopyranosyl-N-acetylglucosaminyl-diphospho-decaprenol beta-1,3/1,4-galactofuranosyltransferase